MHYISLHFIIYQQAIAPWKNKPSSPSLPARPPRFVTIYRGPSHTYRVQRLTESSSYSFRIQATSPAGEGPFTATHTFITAKSVPPAMKGNFQIIIINQSINIFSPARVLGYERCCWRMHFMFFGYSVMVSKCCQLTTHNKGDDIHWQNKAYSLLNSFRLVMF